MNSASPKYTYYKHWKTFVHALLTTQKPLTPKVAKTDTVAAYSGVLLRMPFLDLELLLLRLLCTTHTSSSLSAPSPDQQHSNNS